MRYVAQYPTFTVGIRSEKTRLTSDGEVIMREESMVAEFRPHGWRQRDLEVALLSFQFSGLFQSEGEAELLEPAYRLSYYDTDEEAELRGWDAETAEFVDKRLQASRAYGRDFVLVPEIAIPAPWPKYDEFDGDATELVLTIHNVIGVPFEDALAYEDSKWGQRREDVIEALQEAIKVRDEGKVVVGG